MQTSVLPGLKVGAQAGYPVRDSLSFAASVLLPGRLYPHPQCLNLSSQVRSCRAYAMYSFTLTLRVYKIFPETTDSVLVAATCESAGGECRFLYCPREN